MIHKLESSQIIKYKERQSDPFYTFKPTKINLN